MTRLSLARAGDYAGLLRRFWYVPLGLGIFMLVSLQAFRPETTYVASGRIGFVVEVSYFELEPVRNALVDQLGSSWLTEELHQSVPGSENVQLSGDEAYRPLGFFDLAGRGTDPVLVTRTTQAALDLLLVWINDQRTAAGGDEVVPMVALRSVDSATKQALGGWLGGGALSGLIVGSVLVAVAKSGQLPLRTAGDVTPFVGTVPVFGMGGTQEPSASRFASSVSSRVAVEPVSSDRPRLIDAMHRLLGDAVHIVEIDDSASADERVVMVIETGRTTADEFQGAVDRVRSAGLELAAVVAL